MNCIFLKIQVPSTPQVIHNSQRDCFALKLQDRQLAQEHLTSQSRHQGTFLKHRFLRFSPLFSSNLPFLANILIAKSLRRRQKTAIGHHARINRSLAPLLCVLLSVLIYVKCLREVLTLVSALLSRKERTSRIRRLVQLMERLHMFTDVQLRQLQECISHAPSISRVWEQRLLGRHL